jgi:hypothetical protein
VGFFPSGIFSYGTLSASAQVYGITWPAGTEIDRREENGDYIVTLRDNAIINNMALAKGECAFYSTGLLKYGVSSAPFFIGKVAIPQGVNIDVYEEGDVSISADSGFEYDGMFFRFLRCNKNGKADHGIFAENTVVDGIEFLKDCLGTAFYESGRIKAGAFAKDTIIDGIKFRAGLSYIRPGVRYFKAPDRTTIIFYESGKVKQGVLAEDTLIGGKQFRSADIVGFDEQGNIILLGNDVESHLAVI